MGEVFTAERMSPTVGAQVRAARSRTRVLLVGGILAGPLFIGVAGLQVLLRDGFDLAEHPLSLLGLGGLGWIQIANFVVSGVLAVGLALGLSDALQRGRGAVWLPRLVALFGVGLIAGGVFIPDPAYGFPPGAPLGRPETLSWHAIVHAIAPALGFLSLVAACLVFARRSRSQGRRRWAAYSVATAIAVLLLAAWPGEDGASVRLAVAMVLAWAWVTALSARTLHELYR